MLYGLGPGEMIICLVPLFLIFLIVGIVLWITNRAIGSEDEDNDT
jgi:hypothetical protein